MIREFEIEKKNIFFCFFSSRHLVAGATGTRIEWIKIFVILIEMYFVTSCAASSEQRAHSTHVNQLNDDIVSPCLIRRCSRFWCLRECVRRFFFRSFYFIFFFVYLSNHRVEVSYNVNQFSRARTRTDRAPHIIWFEHWDFCRCDCNNYGAHAVAYCLCLLKTFQHTMKYCGDWRPKHQHINTHFMRFACVPNWDCMRFQTIRLCNRNGSTASRTSYVSVSSTSTSTSTIISVDYYFNLLFDNLIVARITNWKFH